MNKYIVKCPAKINLFLNITGKENEMHILKMINQSISLYDYLNIETMDENIITLSCNKENIPLDEKNSVYKAILLLKKQFNIKHGFKVDIEKNIPVESGLGGESTDAAGMIKALNDIYNLNLSINDLYDIGYKIGYDVPFCLLGGSAIIIKNDIKSYNLPNYYYVIIKPGFSFSTKKMYEMYDEKVDIYEERHFSLGYNDFEKIVPEDIISIKKELLKLGAIYANLSGSGSAIIGTFKTKVEQQRIYDYFCTKYETYIAEACDGIKVLKKDH